MLLNPEVEECNQGGEIMAKHRHKTLLDSGMLEHTITGMIRAGLLRYEGCKKPKCEGSCNGIKQEDRDPKTVDYWYNATRCGMLWTMSPPSRWPKYWRGIWKSVK